MPGGGYVGGLLACVALAFSSSVTTSVQSAFETRGWWAFLFSDFRGTRTYWLVILMARDMVIVVISVACVGDRAAQLLITSAISITSGPARPAPPEAAGPGERHLPSEFLLGGTQPGEHGSDLQYRVALLIWARATGSFADAKRVLLEFYMHSCM